MALFWKKQRKQERLPMPPPLEEINLPETPEQLPEYPGRMTEMSEMQEIPEFPEETQEMPQQRTEPVTSEEMDTAVESFDKQIDILKERLNKGDFSAYKAKKPEIVPADIYKKVNYPEEITDTEEVQTIEEDQYEIEQDMLETLKMTRGLDFTKPLYVLVDHYKAVIEELSESRNLLKNSEDILFRLNEMKNESDKKYEQWRMQMEDIQRKLIFVDKSLFEGDKI
jgi:hypothetical protein